MVNKRGVEILDEASIGSTSRADSGRYGRAPDLRPGVRFWAAGRGQQDWFGLQFHGKAGRHALKTLRDELRACGARYYHEAKNDEAQRTSDGGKIDYVWQVSEVSGPLDLRRLRLVQRACERIAELAPTPPTPEGGPAL